MVRLLKLSDKTVLKKRLKVKNTCMSVFFFFFKRRLDQSLNAALHC